MLEGRFRAGIEKRQAISVSSAVAAMMPGPAKLPRIENVNRH